MKKLLLFIAVLVTGYFAIAQRKVPPELELRLQGKTKVVDIMREVNTYYDYGRINVSDEQGITEEWEGNDYKEWKKWEYWAMRRLNPDGTLANFRKKNYQAQKEVDTKFGNELRSAEENLRQNPQHPDEHGSNLSNSPNSSYGGWSFVGPYDGGTVVGARPTISIFVPAPTTVPPS